MPTRLLYNPADYVNASTPMFDNIVGIITDQTERIGRNINRIREKQALVEERTFQANFQRSMQAERLEASAEESAKQRRFSATQNLLQMNQDMEKHEDLMDWRWASLEMKQRKEWDARISAANDQFADEVEKRKETITKRWNVLRRSGLVDANSSPGEELQIGYDKEADQFTVIDPFAGTEVPYGQWTAQNNPLYNFANLILDNKNVYDWADSNLMDVEDSFSGSVVGTTATGEDAQLPDTFVTGEGRVLYGQDQIRSIVDQIRHSTPGSEMWLNGVGVLEDLMDNDSNTGFLFKDQEEVEPFDSNRVATIAGNVRELSNTNTYMGVLFDSDGNRKPAVIDDANLSKYIPNPTEYALSNVPDQRYEPKTIHEMRNAIERQRIDFELSKDDKAYKMQENAINDLINLGTETLIQYGDQMAIPDQLKDRKPMADLVYYMRLNESELMKDKPNVKRLFMFPSSDEEIEAIENDRLSKSPGIPRLTDRDQAYQSYFGTTKKDQYPTGINF